MVKTMKDGSKVKTEIDPDDPILQKVGVTRRIKRTVPVSSLDNLNARESRAVIKRPVS